MQIGAQLYTVRTYCQNEKDLGRTLGRIAAMGYQTVQLSALGPIAPQRIKALCDDNGLGIVLTHNPEGDFLNGIDAMIERHQLYGCKYAGLGMLPERYHSPEWLSHFAEDFGPAAEKLKAAGIKLMYHNHAFEFAHLPDGRTMMDHLLEMLPADLMGVTADTYWLQFGGVDVCAWLQSHADRLHCVHLKDYVPMKFEARMAAIGQGNLDFARILQILKTSGVTEHALVEQDDCYGASPFDCLKQSFDALQTL
ncbi:MAG: sugar phosphate isomerase/epimerase [Clostridia bacterium]|nr:sugar phosphate isomerase/epimerase [Clostridia bacterium]